MKVDRIRSVGIVKHIEPHLSFTDSRLKVPFLDELAQRMVQAPDTLLVLAAFEEDEIRAFLIAQNPGTHLPYMVVVQTWSHPENPRKWFEPFLARLVMWTAAHDKDYIRAETMRNGEAMFRRFGFEPKLQVLVYDLVKTGFHELLIVRPEEIFQCLVSSTPEQSL